MEADRGRGDNNENPDVEVVDDVLFNFPLAPPIANPPPPLMQMPPPVLKPNISESAAERAIYIWELNDKSLPIPIIPCPDIVNPTKEPDRDSSVSLLDTIDNISSPPFIRGMEIGKPIEWQLQLKKNTTSNNEMEIQLVLFCRKIFNFATNPVWAKLSYEIVDDSGMATFTSGSVCDASLLSFTQGSSHACSIGTKSVLQSKRNELINENGVLCFRLRLNIYKDLPPPLIKQLGNPETDDIYRSYGGQPPAKRKRLELGAAGWSPLLSSLDGLWKSREETGDITILCGNKILKAHKFILSSRSEVFMGMLSSQMESVEKATNQVSVEDISPEIMNVLLEFLYLNDTHHLDWANVDHICALIYAAEKYWIQPVLMRCYRTLMTMMNFENFGKIAKVTFMYNCETEFKEEVRHFFQSHQMTLNGVASFQQFARDDFDEFLKLFFYPQSV